MNKVKDIERDIQSLNNSEFQAFRKWFWDFDAEAWDKQFEKDSLSGKLDLVAEEAIKSFKSGNCSEI